MKKFLSIVMMTVSLLFAAVTVNGQVKIGADNTPKAFSVLELQAQYTSGVFGGLRLPQMTAEQRDQLNTLYDFTTNVESFGLMIYNTTVNCVEYWNSKKWVSLCLGTANITLVGACNPEIPFNSDGTEQCTFTPVDEVPCGEAFQVYITAGAAYATLQIVNEYTSAFTLSFAPNNSSNVRLAVVRVTNNCTGEFKDFVFTQAGASCPPGAAGFSVSATSTTLCGSSGAVIGYVTNPQPEMSYVWTSNGTVVHTGNYLEITHAGIYTVYAGLMGCETPQPRTITVTKGGGISPVAPVIMASNGGILCAGSSVVLTANSVSHPVQWFHNGNLYGTGNQLTLNLPEHAGSWFAIQQDGSCGSRISNIVYVIDQTGGNPTLPAPVATVNGLPLSGSITLCDNGTLALAVTNHAAFPGGTIYEWFVNGISLSSSTNPVVYTIVPDVSPITLSVQANNSSNGCPTTALSSPVTITQTAPFPTIINNGNASAAICGSTPVVLITAYTLGAAYEWFKDGVPISVPNAQNPTVNTNTYHAAEAGTYTVRYKDAAGCWSQLSTPIAVTQNAAISSFNWLVEPTTPVVVGSQITYTVIASPNANAFSWTPSNPAMVTITPVPPGSSASIDFLSLGTFTLTVEATNPCGVAQLEKEITVIAPCTTITSVSINPSTTVTKHLDIDGNPKTPEDAVAVFVAKATGATAYEWYVNNVLQSETSDTLTCTILPGSVRSDTIYVAAVNACTGSNTAKSVAVILNVVKDNPIALSGNYRISGKVCLDIAKTDYGAGNECLPPTSRYDDFNNGTNLNMTYTFNNDAAYSNLTFDVLDPSGLLTVANPITWSGNIATIHFNNTSNNIYVKALGKTKTTALKVTVIAKFKNDSDVLEQIELEVSVQDCACGCAVKATGGGWLTFMCYNLGAANIVKTMSPDQQAAHTTPANNYGDLYQWGRQADGHQVRTSARYPNNNGTTENYQVPDTDLDGNGQVAVGKNGYGKFIKANIATNWRTQKNNLWRTGTDAAPAKTTNDPCPDGWRLPTTLEFQKIVNNNGAAVSYSGSYTATSGNTFTWNTTGTVGIKVSPDGGTTTTLFLPAAGYRHPDTGEPTNVNAGSEYWSSSVYETVGLSLYVYSTIIRPKNNAYRAHGFSIRCIMDAPSITSPPAQPSAIGGPNPVCPNSTDLIYSVTEVAGVTYMWELPAGWIQTAGGNTHSITVTAGTADGTITVTPYNAGGAGAPRTLAVAISTEDLTGNYRISGKVCFDIAHTNYAAGNECLPLTSRTDDFNSGTNLAFTYIFHHELPYTDLTFAVIDTGGLLVASNPITWSGNVATILFNNTDNNLYSKVTGRTKNNAYTITVIAYFKDNTSMCKKVVVREITIQDCACGCAVKTVGGGWLTFMCYNLGAAEIVKEMTPNEQAAHTTPADNYGDLFQWGRRADGHESRTSESYPTNNTTSQNGAVSDTYLDANGQVLSTHGAYGKFIKASTTYDWRNPSSLTSLWNRGSETVPAKSANDPCPTGWRMPVTKEFQAIVNGIINAHDYTSGAASSGNTFTWHEPTPGTGTAGLKISPDGGSTTTLFLPVTGGRGYGSSAIGTPGTGFYWSSSVCGSTNGYYLSVTDTRITPGSNTYRAQGWGIRCILDVPPVVLIPEQPGAINGPNPACSNAENLAYSVTNDAAVTFYAWDLPTGWTQTAGGNSNSITVTAGTAGGTITVTPYNAGGAGISRSLEVTIVAAAPVQPSAITGTTPICQNTTNVTYSVTNETGVTYTWAVPAGWNITAGQGSNSITATVGTAGGTITCTPSNACGNGTARTLAVTVITAVPAQPGTITGTAAVCASTAGLTYSVTNTTGVTYTWAVPAGWSITAGQGTNSITVTSGTAGGNISCTPSNVCGNGTVRTLAVTIGASAVPAQPSTITGTAAVCASATGLTYSVTNVTGVTYTWAVPAGWSITTGQGSNSITVTAGTAGGTITVTPGNICGNGTARTLAVTIGATAVPAQPSTITGSTPVCQNKTGLTYSVTNVTGVTYTWAVPTGWTITAGQGTNSVTVTSGTAGGTITVTPSNVCGNGTARTLAVTVTAAVPAQPSTITGTTPVCQNKTGLTYSVTNVTGVTYTWAVPAGWTITAGQGTNSITATSGTAGGTITCTPSNACGNGTARTLAVEVTTAVPAQPSTITGTTPVCQNKTGLTYSVTNVAGTTYTWSLPTGWTQTAGGTTNSITVTAGTAGGTITCTPSNACGNGTARTLAVTVTTAVPAQPSTITGTTPVCQNKTGLTYSVTNETGVTYTWTVPSGWTITAGQGSNSITATAGTAGGNITVTPSNACGNGTARILAVTVTAAVPAQPSTITGSTPVCQNKTGLTYSVTNVTGVTYTWAVPTGWSVTAGQGTNSATVTAGTAGGTITCTPSNACGNGTARTLAVEVTTAVPAQPSTITGTTPVCQNKTGLTYSVTNVAGTTYTWTLPTGWTQTAGGTTNSITVTAGTAGGTITCTPSNACGNGTARTLAVTVTAAVPAQPSTITGTTPVCQNKTGLTYSVTNVTGVTYTWAVPTGWSITAGQGTNSITATSGTAGGTITCTPSNACGNGTARTLAVEVTTAVPAQPSTITGTTPVCQNKTGLTYSVTNVTGVTYTWAVPTGWTITAGQGTNSVTVTSGTAGGTITCTPSNACGNGTARTFAVTMTLLPGQPNAITGPTSVCAITGANYSITNYTGETYTWTVPTDWIIEKGQNTNTISVASGTAGGTISVLPSNVCGNGTARTLAVQVPTRVLDNSGNYGIRGKICYDVKKSNDNATCKTHATRVDDFNNYGTLDFAYTFIAKNSLSYSNLTFEVNDPNGLLVSPGAITWSSGNTATIHFNNASNNLNNKAYGKTKANALKVTIRANYTDNTGACKYVQLEASVADCYCGCPVKSTDGGYLTFMCYNLGATAVSSMTPDEQAACTLLNSNGVSINYGPLYQWGRTTDGHQARSSSTYAGTVTGTSNFANGGQIVSTHAAYGKFIKPSDGTTLDWRSQRNVQWTVYKPEGDPCPDGWRVPSAEEWQKIVNGIQDNYAYGSGPGSSGNYFTWNTSGTVGMKFSPDGFNTTLFLPAGGSRDSSGDLNNVGVQGHYWTCTGDFEQTLSSGTRWESRYFGIYSNNIRSRGNGYRAHGFSVRCISTTN